MDTKIFTKDVIINESGHLSIFLEGQNSQVFFNMYFMSLNQMFSLNVFYNVLKECSTDSSCKILICNQKIHFTSNDNTKNNVEMDFFGAFFGPL
jgi:hypothetical protein